MSAFDLYSFSEYRQALKERVKRLKKQNSSLTLRRIADRIPVQYTYLSKALNDDVTHLSEDHLFRMARFLDFLPDEIDYLILLRSLEVTQEEDRRESLIKKIETIRRQRSVSAEYASSSSEQLFREMQYLFDPLCVVVRMALMIKEFKKDPLPLCSKLGITREKLREVLEVLDQSGFIELGEGRFEIKKTKKNKLHFGREHPLMRIHQSHLKTQLNSRLIQTSESEKENFLVTFTADNEGFEKIKNAFQTFIKEVQDLTQEGRHKNVYQLNFDFLKWF